MIEGWGSGPAFYFRRAGTNTSRFRFLKQQGLKNPFRLYTINRPKGKGTKTLEVLHMNLSLVVQHLVAQEKANGSDMAAEALGKLLEETSIVYYEYMTEEEIAQYIFDVYFDDRITHLQNGLSRTAGEVTIVRN
jgi:hypothetical protein